MSLNEIEKNLDNLEKQSTDVLVRYIHELLVNKRKLDNKNASLRTEIKYLNRHLQQLRDRITKILSTSIKEDNVWEDKKHE